MLLLLDYLANLVYWQGNILVRLLDQGRLVVPAVLHFPEYLARLLDQGRLARPAGLVLRDHLEFLARLGRPSHRGCLALPSHRGCLVLPVVLYFRGCLVLPVDLDRLLHPVVRQSDQCLPTD